MKILRPEEVTPETILRYDELSPEELAEAYALVTAAFTAADLQRFTELDEGVPAEEVIQEMEETQKQFDQRVK
jgi:hypothetical protein